MLVPGEITEGAIVSIASMPVWAFWSRRPMMDIDLARMSPEQSKELYVRTQMAMNNLRCVTPPGIQDWMSARRAMN
jgi:hypothetical protein